MVSCLKSLLITLLITCYFTQILAADCTNTIDCYTKAIENLNEDRKLILNYKEKLTLIIQGKAQEIQASMEIKFKERQSEWEKKYEELKKSYENQIEVFKNRVAELEKKTADLQGEITRHTTYTNKNDHMYIESEKHDDIFEALEKGIIEKVGTPNGWNDTSYKVNPWNSKKILNIGAGPNNNGNGLLIKVKEGYNVVWIRCHNDVFETFRFKYSDGQQEDLGKFACGKRSLNEISPDGGSPDSYSAFHFWMPVPVPRAGNLMAYSDINSNNWISGIGFGKNLWNHAKNSAVAYHWKLNGGTDGWNADSWNSDQLGLIRSGIINELFVPVVHSNKDKLFYIVEHNNNWLGTMHTSVKVNGIPVERLRTSYSNNPFATHFNSKIYMRYLAARVPKELIIPDTKHIKVEIDMRDQNQNINYREAGTHDFE